MIKNGISILNYFHWCDLEWTLQSLYSQVSYDHFYAILGLKLMMKHKESLWSPGNELLNSDCFIGKSFFVWLLSLRDDEISFNIKGKSSWNFSGKWTALL